MRRKLLVTGGGGFIGSHVVNLLKNSNSIDLIVWDREKMGDFLQKGDRRRTLNLVQPDMVLHLAWCTASGNDSKMTVAHDIWSHATLQFIDECLNENIWFINAGSPCENNGHYLRNSPYGEAKSQIRDFLIKEMIANSITQLEMQYVFSLDDKRPSVLKHFIESKDFIMFKLSDPGKKLDFIAVEDIAAGVRTIIENNIFGPIYLGSGKLRSVEQFIYSANKILNLKNMPEKIFQCSDSVLQPKELISVGWAAEYTSNFFHKPLSQ
jgi:nucleoside-diphosphate-sugar epimerase